MRRLIPILCASALTLAMPLRAQVRLDGVIRDDSSGVAIPAAHIELISPFQRSMGTRTADSLGTFTFPLPRLGEYQLRISARGYRQVQVPLRTEANAYVNAEIRLRHGGALASPLTYLARTQVLPNAALNGYYTRLRAGRGAFFTRMHVEQVRPAYVSDLIGTVPGVVVQRGGQDDEHRTLLARTGCVLRTYVDGQLLEYRPATGEPGPAALDTQVDQTIVEGIEVYVDPATVPAELGGGPDATCGAVGVWTRRRM
jgi:hypothetical protein